MSEQEIKQLLIEEGWVSREAMDRACLAMQERGGGLVEMLIQEGFLKEKDFISFMSRHLGIPFISIASVHLDPDWIQLIPQKLAYRYDSIIVSKLGNILTVAMSNPLNLEAIDDLKRATKMQIIPVFAPVSEIRAALDDYFENAGHLSQILELAEEADADIKVIEEISDAEALEIKETDVPLIKMVNLVLQDAIKQRASDIHFERYEERFRVRYRIDGVLKEAVMPPIKMHPSVVARLKILSLLDITEKRIPQDGRFKIKLGRKEINFRVSVLPTYFGEKIVLRILDASSLGHGLEKLGFTKTNLEKVQDAISKPYGMVLITGPTGSGKSTTLYSILNQLNTSERNIMTVEDPVEYLIEGITQTQVHPEIGFTFAGGLRSLLRQNPDIILVGEIRDSETADIAVKAALTGHLLFSTLHTNSAAGAVTRLVDMKAEPFLIGSSLLVSVAQRLCRKICENCRQSVEIPKEVLSRLGLVLTLPSGKAFQGKGCNQCHGSGYHGRMAVSEVLVVDDEIREMITRRKSSFGIETRAVEKGMKTLFEDAIAKFSAGHTTLEEILRITSEENF
ncbi:MAG: Flp pilus assembly complex ATPase component TadA [Candidatus Omnitrophica bacterium]|nr:Flp pilus assembly complex ATPase component TadA [Candidatus Omnitrophota bacterium]